MLKIFFLLKYFVILALTTLKNTTMGKLTLTEEEQRIQKRHNKINAILDSCEKDLVRHRKMLRMYTISIDSRKQVLKCFLQGNYHITSVTFFN